MKIGIVILNYNNYKVTIKCIKALYKHYSQEELNLVIVENGSKNDSLLMISSFLKNNKFEHQIIKENKIDQKSNHNINIISIRENVGFARGNNFGIRYLLKKQVEHILILTNDIIIVDNIIPHLINSLEKRKDIGMVSPMLIKEDNTIDYNCCRRSPSNTELIIESLKFLNFSFITKNFNKTKLLIQQPELLEKNIITCEILSGSCLMAKSSIWEELGGFDENTYLYHEENILFHKLENLDLKSAILPKQKVIHLGAQSTGTMANVSLLYAELESLMYYLQTYKKISFFSIAIIRIIKLSRIYSLKMKNYLKSVKL
jgi:GT2 family glycosyltransferase